MTAYYNEFDPYAAQWLRNLISAGHIAPGDVDERSIEDVRPDDLRGYTQCHFFAGIGVWSLALRRAGWADDQPVWTGSCPCQPFSAAGKGGGFADERHLWPAFLHLIRECGPTVVFGEQVASKDGLGWLDLVQADLEGSGYACGAFDTCSAGHGVEWEESQAGDWLQRAIHDCGDPWIAEQLGDFADFARGNFSEGGHHIRQRLRFVAERLDDAAGARHVRAFEGPESDPRNEARLRLSGAGRGIDELAICCDPERYDRGGCAYPDCGMEYSEGDGWVERRAEPSRWGVAGGCGLGGMDDDDAGLEGQRGGHQAEGGRDGAVRPVAEAGELGGLADTDVIGRLGRRSGEAGAEPGSLERPERLLNAGGMADADGRQPRQAGPLQSGGQYGQQQEDGRSGDGSGRADPSNRDGRRVDWLFCRDGKWRAARSGAFPLAHGATSRVGRLRAYGNAVDAEATTQFIEAYLETEADRFRLTDVSLSSRDEGVFG